MATSGLILQLGCDVSTSSAFSAGLSAFKQRPLRCFPQKNCPQLILKRRGIIKIRNTGFGGESCGEKPHKGLISMSLVLEEDEKNKEENLLPERDELWLEMRSECRKDAEAEPTLASYLYSTILAHRSLENALAFHIGNKLSNSTLLSSQLYNLIADVFMEDAYIRECIRADIKAFRERDAACVSYSHCLLNFKGFSACQAHRVAHRLWNQGRTSLALAIQSRVSEVFAVDIHPAARIGKGAFFDHADRKSVV